MQYPEIKKICCYGAGLIGAGWATSFSIKGIEVCMYEQSAESIEKAKEHLERNYSVMVEGKLISKEEAEAAKKLIHCSLNIKEALSGVQYVQESVNERYEIKEQVFKSIDKYCGSEVIIGSSSSSLLISKMAEFSKYPQRCICVHPYNPPHLIPLVELVGIPGGEEAVEHIRKFMLKIGKKPVVLKKETKGYIANRFQVVVGREIVELVKRGVCSVEDCETALTYGPGLRWAIMGHNLTMQLGGGEGGVREMFEKVVAKGSDRSSYLDDLGNWIKYPDDWPETVQEGIDETLAHRSPDIGNDNESLAEYRDKMLIEILKLHQNIKLENVKPEDKNE